MIATRVQPRILPTNARILGELRMGPMHFGELAARLRLAVRDDEWLDARLADLMEHDLVDYRPEEYANAGAPLYELGISAWAVKGRRRGGHSVLVQRRARA